MSTVILTTPEELARLIRTAVDEAIEERERARAARPTPATTDWIKAPEAATILGVSERWLRSMKDVPVHGSGRQRRYKRSELEAYLVARGKAA